MHMSQTSHPPLSRIHPVPLITQKPAVPFLLGHPSYTAPHIPHTRGHKDPTNPTPPNHINHHHKQACRRLFQNHCEYPTLHICAHTPFEYPPPICIASSPTIATMARSLFTSGTAGQLSTATSISTTSLSSLTSPSAGDCIITGSLPSLNPV